MSKEQVFDAILVGAGINSLVCAALLTRAGRRVCVIDRNAEFGGTIRTEEATIPGYRHDLMSCWYPLFVAGPAYAELSGELAREGVRFVHSDRPSAVVMEDGRHFVLTKDGEANRRRLNEVAVGDGDRFRSDMNALAAELPTIFTLLGGDLWSRSTMKHLAGRWWRQGTVGLSAFLGDSLASCRTWTERTFQSELASAMFAPWVLHAGLDPDSAYSGLMARVIAFTLENVGCPIVKGGSSELVYGFNRLLARNGAQFRKGSHVERIVVKGDRACGVMTATGELLSAPIVICSVTPDRLYGEMLPAKVVPEEVRRRAQTYRYGRADMQIHLALSRPAQWIFDELNGVALVHLSSGVDQIAAATRQAAAGLLPANPTIVVGQPAVQDPTRVPDGGGQLWIQLQEMPRRLLGDAAGEIEVNPRGEWTDHAARQFADRVIRRLENHIPSLRDTIVGVAVLSPADLERLNCNLVGGDPYCGDCQLDQFGTWRPFPGRKGHETGLRGLWHIGAATHPGPGLGGGSGYIVAKRLVR